MDQETKDYLNQTFSLPHDVVQLPTGGIFYKTKQKSVKVGYLTANDENLIVNSLQKKGENIVLNLIRNKIYEPDLKVNELLDSDIQAILLFLRNTSFGPEYKFTLKDPATDKIFEASVVLDELDIRKTNVKPNNDGVFETKLPKTEAVVKLKPLTFYEEYELEQQAEKYPIGRVAPTVTWKLNKQIVELNGSTDKTQIATFIESMPIMDSKYIKKFLSDNIPSLDLTRTIQAPSGEMVTTSIAFGVEFFRPFF
jgi:hypothetical protein